MHHAPAVPSRCVHHIGQHTTFKTHQVEVGLADIEEVQHVASLLLLLAQQLPEVDDGQRRVQGDGQERGDHEHDCCCRSLFTESGSASPRPPAVGRRTVSFDRGAPLLLLGALCVCVCVVASWLVSGRAGACWAAWKWGLGRLKGVGVVRCQKKQERESEKPAPASESRCEAEADAACSKSCEN